MENTTPLYNTYGDLYDAPQIVYSIDGNSEEIKEISPDTRIDSLEGLLYGDFSSSNIKYIDNQLVTVSKVQMICKCKYKTI